jgi:hypothetical protein
MFAAGIYLNGRNASVVYWFSVCTVTFFRVPVNVNGGVYVDDTGVPQSSPHIERVVGREVDGDRFLEPALGDRLCVHRQRARAAFAGAAVVGEVEADRAAAPGQRFRGGDRVFLQTEPAVDEVGLRSSTRNAKPPR